LFCFQKGGSLLPSLHHPSMGIFGDNHPEVDPIVWTKIE
jgi:hypothetical protein